MDHLHRVNHFIDTPPRFLQQQSIEVQLEGLNIPVNTFQHITESFAARLSTFRTAQSWLFWILNRWLH